MIFCDTHIHLLAPEWTSTATERIAAAAAAGIGYLLQPGVRVRDWDMLLALALRHSQVYLAPGLHPLYADQWNAAAEERLRELTRQPKVVAIGEIGLDGTGPVPLPEQERVLVAQLQIALDAGLPVLLHGRQATGALLKVIRDLAVGRRVGGIWHGFSGSLQVAHELVELGFMIGVGPLLLRENARKLPQAVRAVPSEALVLETDAPDMAATADVLLVVAQRVARLRGWSIAETARITTENALRLLKIRHAGGDRRTTFVNHGDRPG